MQGQVKYQAIQTEMQDKVVIIITRVFDVDRNSVSLRGQPIGHKFQGVIYCYTI